MSTVGRQDAAGRAGAPLGVFEDGELVELLPSGTPAYDVVLDAGQEVLLVCPAHPDQSVVDCLECGPAGEDGWGG